MSGQRSGARDGETTFLVEMAAERGFTARALGASIFTDGGSLCDLQFMVRDTVRCHFDEDHAPTIIRLLFRADDPSR